MKVRDLLLKVCEAGRSAKDPEVHESFKYWEELITNHRRSDNKDEPDI